MKKIFYLFIPLVFFASCSVIPHETKLSYEKNNHNYFPKTFDEAEMWFDSIHAQNDIVPKYQNFLAH